MKNTLIFVVCLISLSCSSVNTQITENTDHDWVPYGYGIEFCSEYETSSPNLCTKTTNIKASYIFQNGKTYLFVDTLCICPAGSNECPHGLGNRSILFEEDIAEFIKKIFNESHRFDDHWRFADETDSANLLQICRNKYEIGQALKNANALSAICINGVWTDYGIMLLGFKPLTSRNAGIVLVFK